MAQAVVSIYGQMNRVLITNDDGIDAAGIIALAGLAEQFFEEIWIVAPKDEASQIGHRVTTDEPLRLEKRGERIFAVDGTPADCTRVGLYLMDQKPDWVWSGINHGGNLGKHDYYISGTLAAAREATFFGVKAMAASHYIKAGQEINWEKAAELTARAFTTINERKSSEQGILWNVNLPHRSPEDQNQPELIFCEPEEEPLDVNFRKNDDGKELIYTGNYHSRSRNDGSDVAVCFGGDIAISEINTRGNSKG